MTALVRNLATMTRAGVLTPGSDGTARVVAQLGDGERIRRARVHPIAILAALRTYASGRGVRGRGEWAPVREIVDALDAAFYAAFGNVEPVRKRFLLALDVSGSMTCGKVAGVPGLTPRDASAALALVTVATEPNVRGGRLLRRPGRLREERPWPLPRPHGRPDAAAALAASASRRRGADGVRPAVRRHRLCAADAVRAVARAGDRRVRDLHRLARPGRATSTRPLRSATTAAPRASRHGWSWSAWSRTASRSPIPQTRRCSTSSASTRRRRS